MHEGIDEVSMRGVNSGAAADLIEQNRESLVERWAAKVKADEDNRSAHHLSPSGLRDHLPQVLDEIGEVLRAGEEPEIHNTREARVNAYSRLLQNYRAQDLAMEISILRLTLLDCLNDALLNEATVVEVGEYLRATRCIHLYLDEELRYAISIFSESSGS